MSDHNNYLVNEIYYTLHGEGVRYGIPHVFVRFAQCNLACDFCDTEFESYRQLTGEQIVEQVSALWQHQPLDDTTVEGATRRQSVTSSINPVKNVLFCGGEPLLQLDARLIALFHAAGWFICIETNGTRAVPEGVDWITCSPKVAEHALKLEFAHELKYVRGYGQGIPRPQVSADHYLISPLFEGDQVDARTLDWCVALVKDNPLWRLTVQHHKINFGGMR